MSPTPQGISPDRPVSARPPRRADPAPTGVLGRGRTLDLLVLVAVLTTFAIGGFWVLTRGVGGVEMSTDEVTLPARPPLEWSATARWKSPPLMPQSGRVLVVGPDRVAMLTADRRVALVEAATGDTVWAGPVPDGQVSTPLARTSVDGRDVVAAQFGDVLAWWAVQDGGAGQVGLPARTRVTFAGTAPLGRSADGRVGVITSAGLQQVEVPGGAIPLAGRADGVVTAASPQGWWHLTPGTAPGRPTPWQMPGAGGPATIAGYVGSSIVTTVDRPRPTVVVHADRDSGVRYLFDGPYAKPTTAGTPGWKPSPSGTWGILGRTLVDLESGTTTDLGVWKTDLVSQDRALGTVGDQAVVVGPTIPRGVLQDREGFPEGILAAGAVVRARESGAEVVYLLPPAQG